jgi:hypothetical protein
MIRVAAVLALVAGVAATAAPAAQDVGALVLDARQVGKGYVLQKPQGGAGLAAPTLDLCSIDYPSERRRTARAQVVYRPPVGASAVSNEVVTYAAGGAGQALREVGSAPARCPRKPVTVNGVQVTYRVSRLAAAGLPSGAVALSVTVGAKSAQVDETLEATIVYVRKGDTLSGIYVYGGPPAARLALATTLAATSLGRLSQSVGGQTA